MPSLKVIRRRISSVKSTQKTTRAMKMVAAARLRRAAEAIVELRPFAQHAEALLAQLAAQVRHGELETMPALFAERPVRQALVVLFTSDRGLAGAFNANAQKAALELGERLRASGQTVRYATVGRKGREHLLRRGVAVEEDWSSLIDVGAAGSWFGGVGSQAAQQLMKAYADGALDSCHLVYNEFLSAIRQRIRTQCLLPLGSLPLDPRPLASGEPAATEAIAEPLFEPSFAALLETVVPLHLQAQLQRALLESRAAEHGARMAAMDAATTNAAKMIDRLTLQFNRARQAAITKELIEILSGAQALEG